ncbi:discoidin domain-containing protein [Bacteroides thetaiotaomicron]|nr:discoidin domain-containing protein [Bacteroides thetaiotaomicron]
MFSANATEPSEGSLAALVDDNINTYYHTIWSGTSPNKQPHYLQINMSELPLQSLRFEYDGRNNGNGAGDVKRVGIWGSDNNNTWTLMGKETYTLPGSRGQHVEPNENIKAGKPYKYIRFIPGSSS